MAETQESSDRPPIEELVRLQRIADGPWSGEASVAVRNIERWSEQHLDCLVAYAMGLERKAKAFDAVARGDVGIGCRPNSNDTMKRDWVAYQLTPPRRCSNDLLTAIEAATREAKP